MSTHADSIWSVLGTQNDFRDPAFRDIRNLLRYVWKRVIPTTGTPESNEPTPLQYDIARTMQLVYEGKLHGKPSDIKHLIVEAFRGVGKSWIASVFAVWVLYWNPTLNILVISASKERADAFSTFTLRLLRELEELQWLMPADDGRDSKIAFDVGPAPAAHAPSVKSVGITGMISGSRADLVICDDIEVPNNSETELKRLKLGEQVKEVDAVVKPRGMVLVLGTPQIEMSLYNTLCDRGYTRRIWPARFPDAAVFAGYRGDLAPYVADKLAADPTLVGKPTDPQRFNEWDLVQREAMYARSGFALQFMLDTSANTANLCPLRLADLIVADIGDEWAPTDLVHTNAREFAADDLVSIGLGSDRLYRGILATKDMARFEGCVMTIDPAGRGKDECAVAVTRMCGPYVFLVAVRGFRSGYTDATLRAIAEMAKRFDVHRVVPEANFGDGMFTALLLPHLKLIHPCAVEEVRSVGQKEKRIIDVLEPVMNQHRLVVSSSVVRDDVCRDVDVAEEEAITYRLFHQMTRLTRDKGSLRHDDRIEAVAMGVSYWVEHMKLTEAEAKRATKSRSQAAMIEQWYENEGYTRESRKKPSERIARYIKQSRPWLK